MGIVYALSILMLAVSFILIKKTDKKINILGFINITIGILFCYNAFVAYVLTFFLIPNSLIILSIINFAISIILILIMLYKRKIQKFEFDKMDFLYIEIIAIVVVFVSILNFGIPFGIQYETGDPSHHYMTAEMYDKGESLLQTEKEVDYVFGTAFAQRKIVSYVNCGIIFKCLDGVIDPFYNYNIFIGLGIFVLFITASSMYTTISKFSENGKTKVIALIVSIIYALGYPLNSFLFGFEYLSMSLLIICLIFDMVYYFKNGEFKLPYIIIIFALLNFGLFHSYYMFVPFMFPVLWIYFCIYSYKKDKKILTKRNIILLTTTLLIPFVLGFIYYMTPAVYKVIINNGIQTQTVMKTSDYLLNKGLAGNGYIYINLYSNFIILLPLAIYIVIKKLKENTFGLLCLILCSVFIEILLVGHVFEKVSIYYLSKNYFVLWFILFYLNYKAIVEIFKKNSKIAIGIIAVYITLIIINTFLVNTKVEYVTDNRNESIVKLCDVFGANKTLLFDRYQELPTEALEIIKYYKDNINYDNKTELMSNMRQEFWFYTLTKYINDPEGQYKGKGQGALEKLNKKTVYNLKKADYIVFFKTSDVYNVLKRMGRFDELGEIIIENDAGGIIKCNK